jgi:Flp pilus assembly protein TadG
MRSPKRAGRRRRGNILVLSAFLLVVLLVLIALSADIGYMYSVKARLQNAADAGACAGAVATPEGSEAARAAAIEFAEKNQLYPGEFTVGNADVELGTWDEATATFTKLEGLNEDGASVVRVVCRRTKAGGNEVPLFFGHLLGSDYTDIVATATARYKTSQCGMIIGLNGVSLSGSSYVDAYRADEGAYVPGSAGLDGHVCSNGDINVSVSAAIYGDAHPGPDHAVTDTSSIGVAGNTQPLKEELSFPAIDPGDAATNNDNDQIPNTPFGVPPITASGDFSLFFPFRIDLPPGTYYFNNFSLTSGSTLGISGKTVIYTTGTFSVSGASIANDTYLPKNLEIYVMGSSVTISGLSNFYGNIYAPSAQVSRSGDADYFGSIVAGEIASSGTGGIHADKSLDFEFFDSGVQRAALVD